MRSTGGRYYGYGDGRLADLAVRGSRAGLGAAIRDLEQALSGDR